MDAVILFIYLVTPKINIIDVGNYGLRLQDALSLVMLFRIRFPIPQDYLKVSNYLGYVLLMLFIGAQLDFKDAVLDMLRLLQYLIIGIFFAKVFAKNIRIIDIFIIVQLMLAFMQFIGVLPNYDTGRGAIVSEKYSGSFGVSSEFTYSMILLMLIRYQRAISRIFFTTLFILNGTTTALLIYLPLLKKIKGNYNIYIYLSAILISFIFPVVFMGIGYDEIMGNAVKLPSDIKAFSEGDFKDGEFLSLIHRSTKAIGIISVFLFNPQYSILGLGFGAVFSPADFGFLRLFANFGLVGIIGFYLIIRRLPTDIFLAVTVANLLFDGIWSSTVGPICVAIYILYSSGRHLPGSEILMHTHSRPIKI